MVRDNERKRPEAVPRTALKRKPAKAPLAVVTIAVASEAASPIVAIAIAEGVGSRKRGTSSTRTRISQASVATTSVTRGGTKVLSARVFWDSMFLERLVEERRFARERDLGANLP